MTASHLKDARLKAGLTQQQAASALSVTQAYLSMLESGRRPVTPSVATRAAQVLDLPPTALPMVPENSLPLNDEELKADLGALGYPGFSYLRGKQARNPAQLLLSTLEQPDLDTRVVEALPWLAWNYADMDWERPVAYAKLHDLQNRLGFVVTLAKELADRRQDQLRSNRLSSAHAALEHGRLAREDTLCHESMTAAERRWLQQHRPEEAKHWNLLTDVQLQHLAYA